MAQGKSLPTFADLQPAISESLLLAINSLGFDRTTPVQASTIPLFMQNKDVIVEAVTGSGKTLAFAVPIIERLLACSPPLKGREIGAVIVAPTRELAAQIHTVFTQLLSAHASTSSTSLPLPLLLTGGSTTIKQDITSFLEEGSSILIGTPGRLEEFLLGSSSIAQPKGKAPTKSFTSVANVKRLEVLVLDEADRLLDLGFAPSLNKLLHHFPKQRRTGLFSATMTDALSQLATLGLRNPTRVTVKVQEKTASLAQRTPASLSNFYVICKEEQKIAQLVRQLQAEVATSPRRKFIVFFSTCAAVDYFYKVLPRLKALHKFTILSLHGKQQPARRAATFSSFTALQPEQACILLCTDIAARGLDLPDVDCVLQVDPPQDPKVFSHRCGRTARAGRDGKAVVFLLQGREEEYVDLLKLRNIPLAKTPYLLADGTESGYLAPEKDEEATKICEALRTTVKTDRDLHDKSLKAFVSAVRSYSKHEASYIFRLSDIKLAQVAYSYGLLRLPAMPEIKSQNTEDWIDADIEWDRFAYVDPAKEAARQAAKPVVSLKRVKRPPRTEAWSKKVDLKQKKLQPSKPNAKAETEQANAENQEIDGGQSDISEDEEAPRKKKRKVVTAQKGKGIQIEFAL